MPRKPVNIDEYLARVSGPVRTVLVRLRRTIRAAVPAAEECISYGMPAFRVRGGVVAGFAVRSDGASYYPFSGSTLAALADELAGFEQTKSALHFGPGQPLPTSLVRKLVRARMAEIAARSERRRPAPGRGRTRRSDASRHRRRARRPAGRASSPRSMASRPSSNSFSAS